ncbi:MAG: hypothetical protein KGN02_03745 [bacterium]|nr:hypothetical protein [bacterium]
MEQTPSYPLRALSIGEIFDRAVTIFMRNFVTLTAIVASMIAPYSVAQYFVISPDRAGLAGVLSQMQHPGKSTPMPPEMIGAVFGLAFIALLLAPIVNNAVAVGVADLYNGREPQYGRSYAVVFRRVWPLIATAIVAAFLVGAIYMGFVMVLAVVAIFGVALVKVFLPLAIVLFVLVGIGILAMILALLMMLLVYAFATYSTTLEGAGVAAAVGSAFRRIFNRTEFRKAALMALAYLALEIAVLTLSSTVSVVVELVLKSYAVELAVSAIFSSVLNAFLVTLLAVYYFDVRTRSEGLDLEVDLGRLTAAP